MKYAVFIATLLTGALALPAPTTLTGEALEKELEILNAPEPWEKRLAAATIELMAREPQKVENREAQKVENREAQKVENRAAQKVENREAQKVENREAQKVENRAAQKVENRAAQKVEN
ncbi:hypothetical protein HBI38_106940 [Parastagonospora nodorum]|nr:hypothetical protein HBI43_052250 [Parastagonospora nodorum]KAH6268631.1 hypothetical protein HBI42_044930 [Parastagonospora nodorum]KAH6321007.1 hypothetical protein HBI38_106940 [Parastagonospora nodorum]